MKKIVIVLCGITLAHIAYAEDFSCYAGKRGACLDYGDKVCSSFAKCVGENATCFESNTCDFRGFVCKSKFDDLAESCKRLANDQEELINKYNNLLLEKKTQSNCVNNARTLLQAQMCIKEPIFR
jgi:hypothetical protein